MSKNTYHNAIELCNGYSSFYELGRSIYKYGGGAWIKLCLSEGGKVYYDSDSIYYDSDPARSKDILNDKDIVGVEIGSTVEGSCVEVGPYFLGFPFSEDDLWETIDNINKEVDFYWNRDNVTTYEIQRGDESYFFDEEDDGDLPDDLQEMFGEWTGNLQEGESCQLSEGVILTRIDKCDWTY